MPNRPAYHADKRANQADDLIQQAMELLSSASPLNHVEAAMNKLAADDLRQARQRLLDGRRARMQDPAAY